MSHSTTELQALQDILAKLDKVLAFLAIGGRNQNDQIKILRGLGFDWAEIGTMVGLNTDAARKRFDAMKSAAKKEKS